MPQIARESKILIIGGSGFIGQHIVKQLEPGTFTPTYRTHKISNGVRFDSMTMQLSSAIDLSNFSHAIILLAESDTLLCAREPQKTDLINIESVKSVLDECRKFGVFPIFISTDAVFDGAKGNYSETDTPNPLLHYGKQKLEIEDYIDKTFEDFLIFRPGKVYGSSRDYPTFLSRWMGDLKNGNLIRCATDHVFCPIDIDDFSFAIVSAIRQNLSGLFHAGGPQKMTYCKLLDLLIEFSPYSHAQANIEQALINDFAVIDPRPIDSSLISDKLFSSLNLSCRFPKDVCRSVAQFKSLL